MKPFALTSSSRMGRFPRILASAAALCAALGLLLSVSARADQESKDVKKSKTEATKPATGKPVKAKSGDKTKTEKILITGSLIPQQVSRKSGVLNTASQVYVIDAEQIRRSGASSVAGVLNRYGMNR